MNQCPKCSNQVPNGIRFCPHCGNGLQEEVSFGNRLGVLIIALCITFAVAVTVSKPNVDLAKPAAVTEIPAWLPATEAPATESPVTETPIPADHRILGTIQASEGTVVYQSPGRENAVVGFVPNGQQVEIFSQDSIETQNNEFWAYVRLQDDAEGWIPLSLINIALVTPQPSPSLPQYGTDGMDLAYIPEGYFAMGQEYIDDEEPVHIVYLDAFWMDKTEVINMMYVRCLRAGVCKPPAYTKSQTHDSYF